MPITDGALNATYLILILYCANSNSSIVLEFKVVYASSKITKVLNDISKVIMPIKRL